MSFATSLKEVDGLCNVGQIYAGTVVRRCTHNFAHEGDHSWKNARIVWTREESGKLDIGASFDEEENE